MRSIQHMHCCGAVPCQSVTNDSWMEIADVYVHLLNDALYLWWWTVDKNKIKIVMMNLKWEEKTKSHCHEIYFEGYRPIQKKKGIYNLFMPFYLLNRFLRYLEIFITGQKDKWFFVKVEKWQSCLQNCHTTIKQTNKFLFRCSIQTIKQTIFSKSFG